MRESTGAAVEKMSQSTNVNISNAAKTLEASIQDYSQEVNKFGADIQRYSAEVSAVINEYSTDVQKYSAQVERYTKEYTWYQDQYVRLDTKFKESLQVLIAN
jgi:outer membrane murein-binding lipoprotein Lpp